MHCFFAPTLTTPLLKIPLLVTHAVYTYYGTTPPNPPTDPKKSAMPQDFLLSQRQLQLSLAKAMKYVMCSLPLAEAAVLLAREMFPSQTARYAIWVSSMRLALSPASVVGCLLGIAGGLIRVWCHQSLGSLFTWEVTVRDDHRLVTSGPYAIVRHPSYVGSALIFAGTTVLLVSRGSLFTEAGMWATTTGKVAAGLLVGRCVFIWVALVRRIGAEDELMKNKFGEQWEEWAKKTPYRLIPFIY